MNLRLKRSTDVVSICAAAVVFTLLLPWIIGVGMGSSPEIAERKQRVEQMSADARQRLEANLAAYENASPYLREEFTELNEAIERDPELGEMLNEYCSWIQSLPPAQREELRKPKEPRDRIELVTKYLRPISPPPPDRHPADRGPQPQQSWAAAWIVYVHHVIEYVETEDRLSNEELAAVIDLLEERDERNAANPAADVAGAKPLWQRGLAVLEEVTRRNRPQDQKQKQELRRRSERISRVISTPSVAKNLNEVKQSPVQFQQRLRQVVVCTLLDLLIDELTKDVTPADFPREFRGDNFAMRGIPGRLTEEQRKKRIALFYRLTLGKGGHEDQIAAFKKLIPKNYLGRERLNAEGFPNHPGGRLPRPRPDGGPPPRFGGPPDGGGRTPPREFRPQDNRDLTPLQRPAQPPAKSPR
ncbi:MAG: hypothetical protein WEB58_09745 [Planctomycetaceae bacterium]